MKIEPGNQIIKPGQTNQRPPRVTGSGGFQEIYQQAVESSSLQPAESSKVQGGFKPAPAQGVCLVDRQNPMGVLEKLEGALDRLEEYRLCLADPSCSLKQAAGYLDQAGKAIEELSMTNYGRGPDSVLGDLVQEVLSTIAMERTRFKRGDYL